MAPVRRSVRRPGASARRELVPRSRAVGLTRLAAEFLGAADAAARTAQAPNKVALYLYGHTLELMIKAVLVCAGSDEPRLRRLGHDLSAAFRVARRQPGAITIPVTPLDYALIGRLSPYYDAKDLEYVATGFRSYPLPADLRELCHRLMDQLGPAIRGSVRRWLRARRSRQSA